MLCGDSLELEDEAQYEHIWQERRNSVEQTQITVVSRRHACHEDAKTNGRSKNQGASCDDGDYLCLPCNRLGDEMRPSHSVVAPSTAASVYRK